MNLIKPQGREFAWLLAAALQGQRPVDQPGIFRSRYLEERIYGLGGWGLRARLELLRNEKVVWSVVYDDLLDPSSMGVYRHTPEGEELVGYVPVPLEGDGRREARRVLEALQGFWAW